MPSSILRPPAARLPFTAPHKGAMMLQSRAPRTRARPVHGLTRMLPSVTDTNCALPNIIRSGEEHQAQLIILSHHHVSTFSTGAFEIMLVNEGNGSKQRDLLFLCFQPKPLSDRPAGPPKPAGWSDPPGSSSLTDRGGVPGGEHSPHTPSKPVQATSFDVASPPGEKEDLALGLQHLCTAPGQELSQPSEAEPVTGSCRGYTERRRQTISYGQRESPVNPGCRWFSKTLKNPSTCADEVKVPSKLSVSKSMKVSDSVAGSRGGSLLELKEGVEEPAEEGGDGEKADKPHVELSSDEEGVDLEESIEESRAERIKRSSLQRVQNLKTVFSREKMDKTRAKTKENLEKTKQKTKENLEKTKQKTRENLEKTKQKTKENLEKTKQKTKENLEKTRHNIEKKMGKLGTRMSVNPERKQKMKTSTDKMKKAFTPDHVVYARSKSAVYKVPPFTFHVKKIREGDVEVVQGTEMVEVSREAETFEGVDGELDNMEVEVEMEMLNGGADEEEAEEDGEEDSHDALPENEEEDRDSD
ncbi:unnamed protein product [Menidia menidia]|uniref:(Atlantic silverside) hypothetical protein n=1 Tax=Menidia menidia TaxID=238744 RepID=A0A8S4AZ50_9TELE|nr:unnamed protein product [Menidia menidia]